MVFHVTNSRLSEKWNAHFSHLINYTVEQMIGLSGPAFAATTNNMERAFWLDRCVWPVHTVPNGNVVYEIVHKDVRYLRRVNEFLFFFF